MVSGGRGGAGRPPAALVGDVSRGAVPCPGRAAGGGRGAGAGPAVAAGNGRSRLACPPAPAAAAGERRELPRRRAGVPPRPRGLGV